MKRSYLDYAWSVIELDLNIEVRSQAKDVYCFTLAGYRETISFNSFFHGLKQYCENKKTGFLYRPIYTPAYERLKRHKCYETEIYLPLLEAGNFIACENLYDFYSKIGWNRKEKKYNLCIKK
jgi:hypothetical protein